METEMLDLSGYTPEERRHLESVMMRQRHEEEKDRIIVEKKREEMKILEETIQKQRNEMHKKVGSELEATCHICMKTKFADGVGHICYYCNIRCCARCGGKVTLRSNKVIWICILCRKKQELLSKTGQWMNQHMSSNDSKQEHDREISLLSDKRAKLERTQSAAEKENQPLERSSSLLRRQYSHQEQSRTNNDMIRGEKNRCGREEEGRLHRKEMEIKQGGMRYHRRGEMSGYKSDSYTSEKSLDRLENPPQRAGSSTVIYQSPSRKYRRGSKGESFMRKEMQTNVKLHQRNLPRQSFSSSDDELKSLSECTSEEREYAERNILSENSIPRDSDINFHLPSSFNHSNNNDNFRREAKSAFVALAEARRLKKMVRFYGSRQSTNDSGIDMGSSVCTSTSIEDSNAFSKRMISWETTQDGRHKIGHLTLKKSGWDADGRSSSVTMLGLKIVGGKLLENGRRGAIIERIKKGSVAEQEGLKPGDEVLEWNGRSLQQISYQDVHDIIAESKKEPQVELRILRKTQMDKSFDKHPYPYRRDSVERRDKMKPSVMITSPGSPDLGSIYRSRNSRISSVGGRIQVKVWFDSSTLKLVVTLVCAVGLVPRPNGLARNPYAKLYLLPDRSEKSKRRTKTLASTNEPKWNQHFIYTSVRRSDLKIKEIEISVWDYIRNSTNDFLGEARIDLAIAPLNDEAEWIHLNPHEETFPSRIDCGTYIPSDHLSPPSTTSRLSDSDTSDFDDTNRRVADGASISSLGSSTSPPPDYEKNEKRRSRRDMISPLEYKTPSYKGSLYKHQSLERDIYNKTSYSGYPQRSRSAAPTDTPSLRFRSRSKSPTSAYERSLSPTSHRAQSYGSVYPIPACGPKIYTRSATSTPVSSPKRRMLPKIPTSVSSALRERIAHDLEHRGMYMKNNHRARQPRQGGGRFSGWNRHHYSGLSDSDLPHQHRSLSPPSARELGFFCGPKKEGDVEDSYSIDSSTFSTQSEQPQKSRFDDYGRRESSQQSPSTSGPPMESLERSLSHSDMSNDKNIGENSYSDLNVHNLPTNDNQRNKCSPSTSERGSVKSIPGARGSPDSYSSLPKKSNSTSQLSATGLLAFLDDRSGTSRRKRSSPSSLITIVRSEEVTPTLSGSNSSINSELSRSAGVVKITEDEKYQNFIGELGPGQLVGRQVLGTPPLGEILVSISLEKGKLVVEVIKVRGLQQNPDLKNIPSRPYAKLYLVKGKKCLEKNKTKAASPSTLEPTYQARFTFKTNPQGCVLQITLWGERKTFMGITQIALSDLDLTRVINGWYKLYKTCLLCWYPLVLRAITIIYAEAGVDP